MRVAGTAFAFVASFAAIVGLMGTGYVLADEPSSPVPWVFGVVLFFFIFWAPLAAGRFLQ